MPTPQEIQEQAAKAAKEQTDKFELLMPSDRNNMDFDFQAGYLAGYASRDAEVARMMAEIARLRGVMKTISSGVYDCAGASEKDGDRVQARQWFELALNIEKRIYE